MSLRDHFVYTLVILPALVSTSAKLNAQDTKPPSGPDTERRRMTIEVAARDPRKLSGHGLRTLRSR